MKKTLTLLVAFLALVISPMQVEAKNMSPTNEDKAYFTSVRDAVLKGNKKWLADQLKLPMDCFVKGQITNIKTKEQFIQNYDEIINEYVRASAQKQKADELFKNYKGFMVGRGSIWMDQVVDDSGKKTYRIYKINNKPRN